MLTILMYCLSFNLVYVVLKSYIYLHKACRFFIFVSFISVSALAGMGDSVALDREVANNVSTPTN